MKKRWIGIAVLCCSLAAWSGAQAETQETAKPLTATGEAPILKRNIARAREEALRQALISVNVAQAEQLVLNPFLAANHDVILKKLSSDPRPYIQDFRVLKETKVNGSLEIQVSALPRTEKLRDDLLRWGILYDRARRPRIGLKTLEEKKPGAGSKGTASPEWTRRLLKRLKGLGFAVEEPVSDAEPYDVEVGGVVTSYGDKTLSAGLHAFRPKPPLELARVGGHFPLDQGKDLAAGLLASALLENLLPAWFRATGEGREFSVRVSGLKSHKQYMEIRDFFNSGRDGFASGVEQMFAPALVTFGVVYSGAASDLVRALGKLQITGGRLHIKEISGLTVSAEIQ